MRRRQKTRCWWVAPCTIGNRTPLTRLGIICFFFRGAFAVRVLEQVVEQWDIRRKRFSRQGLS